MTADRDFVQPRRVALEVEGHELEITPIVVGEVFALMALLEPVLDELVLLDAETLDRAALARLLLRAGAPLLQAVALCTRGHWRTGDDGTRRRVEGAEHLAWLQGLLLDRAAAIAAEVFEVNRDFFVQAAPALRQTAARLAAPPAGDSAGATPSAH